MAKKPIRVIVAEDVELVRYGLCRSLEMSGDVSILAEARNGAEALHLVQMHRPDVVLMDIRMPTIDGIETTRQLKALYPEIKIIVLTESTDDENILKCLLAGADSYCMKTTSLSALMTVMDNVLDNDLVSFDSASFNVIRSLLQQHHAQFVASEEIYAASSDLRDQLDNLSPREKEVLQLIVDGQSNKEIAVTLSLTFHTAKAHVCRVIQKLNVDDRTQAAVKAMQGGLRPRTIAS
jgi:DNA-binding NarL/FixJ family response regulator